MANHENSPSHPEGHPHPLRYEVARNADFAKLAELRIEAMRESLEALGRFDRKRSLDRFRASFTPPRTWKAFAGDELVGFYATTHNPGYVYLNHLYIDPRHQSSGYGTRMLERVIAISEELGLPIRLGALRGSRANDFYLNRGFRVTSEEEWDIFYERSPKAR
mgnify:CR=1 FL=1